MKICRYNFKNIISFGLVENNIVKPIYGFPIKDQPEASGDEILHLDEIQILPPIIPSKIVCVGRNYAEHAKELGNEIPKEPLLFLKAPSAIIKNSDPIIIPEQSQMVEHEGELGVVIGKDCCKLKDSENPLDYILGFISLNDVTARDLQKKDIQFTRAKSFDTFCPISNLIETDLDFNDITIQTKVNGVIKQTGKTSQMVFPVPYLIRYISHQMTLKTGDIIATGTPSGVSKLTHGDICEVEIEGLETLSNPIINLENL